MPLDCDCDECLSYYDGCDCPECLAAIMGASGSGPDSCNCDECVGGGTDDLAYSDAYGDGGDGGGGD